MKGNPSIAEPALGVDLGGSEIKFCLQDASNASSASPVLWKIPTQDGIMLQGIPGFAHSIRSEILRIEENLGKSLEKICIAAPGLAGDGNLWIDYMPGRLKGLEKLNWTWFLNRDLPIKVINDGQAALLGEVWKGAGCGKKHAILYTIGTGVGGGIFSDGKVFRGATGRAGHLGHTSVNYLKSGDICGAPGSIEDTIGQVTLAQRSNGEFQNFSQLSQAFHEGSPTAMAIWEDTSQALAASIASMINITDPEIVILGGGLVETSLPVIEKVSLWLDEFEWRPSGEAVPVVSAHLGQDAGCYGAACVALYPEVLST